jgi:hypothetical protein
MPHMLSALAQAETNKLHPWLIRDVLDNLTPESLAELQTFLSHTDKVVQTGALVFWKYIIDAAFVRRSLKDEFEKIREIRFDPLFGLSLAEDQNEERSLGGIALLTLSDYPVHDQEYRQTLLTLIQESTNTSKENAWVRFLREALIQNKNKEGWSIMLQDILDEPAYYSRNILRAAKVRYQKISSKRIEAKFYL